MAKVLYDVISLQNDWHDGSPSVNDAHFTGRQLFLEPSAKIAEVMKALKEEGLLAKHITRQSIYIDDDEGYSFYIRAKRDHAWLWELRPKT